MGIEEEEIQIKDKDNLSNRIIAENVASLKKGWYIQAQEAFRTPNRWDQKRNMSKHIIIKILNILNKERILKAAQKK
jgi:hypothetical protein